MFCICLRLGFCVFFFARDFVFSFGWEKGFFCQSFFLVLVFISNSVFLCQMVVFLNSKVFFSVFSRFFFFEKNVFQRKGFLKETIVSKRMEEFKNKKHIVFSKKKVFFSKKKGFFFLKRKLFLF